MAYLCRVREGKLLHPFCISKNELQRCDQHCSTSKMRYRKGGNVKGIVKKATAVLLTVTVTCGAVMGISVTASAASLSAGAALAGESLSFLESLFMAGGMSLGLDMILKTQNDINNWDWGELLDDPLNQDQLKDAEDKIGKLYYGATEAYKKTHGNGSGTTPSPAPTSSPDISPPVTVAPINPDDLDIPEDWATLKKNATDKGLLAMGAATAYCMKEAVKGWWDELMDNTSPLKYEGKENPYKNNKYIGYLEYECDGIHDGSHFHSYRKGYVYDSNIANSELSYIEGITFSENGHPYHSFHAYKKDGSSYYGLDSYIVQRDNYSYMNDYRAFTGSGIYNYPSSFDAGTVSTLVENYVFSVPVVIDGKTIPASILPLDKTSLWPSVDTKDDYDNNRTLPSPSYPNLAVPSIKLPTLDELKDLWKQGSDDEENRPTYVTNFITNHTVQPTPEPEPTKKPEVNPNPGGGTDPQPSGSPDPNPDPGGGGDTDPDNPETPTPEEEASPYKADLREIFPFCIPFDLIHLLKVFDAEAEAPVFEFPLDIEMDNPWTGEKVVNYHHTFKLDMADYEPVIKILRIFQVIFFIIALMLITRQQMIKG